MYLTQNRTPAVSILCTTPWQKKLSVSSLPSIYVEKSAWHFHCKPLPWGDYMHLNRWSDTFRYHQRGHTNSWHHSGSMHASNTHKVTGLASGLAYAWGSVYWTNNCLTGIGLLKHYRHRDWRQHVMVVMSVLCGIHDSEEKQAWVERDTKLRLVMEVVPMVKLDTFTRVLPETLE